MLEIRYQFTYNASPFKLIVLSFYRASAKSPKYGSKKVFQVWRVWENLQAQEIFEHAFEVRM